LYLVEGEILRDAGRLDDAMDVYNRALDEIPGNIDLLYARGLLAERMGRVDLLERDLSTIIESDPEHADALNALGYTLADRTDRYDEASEYIQRALALKPDNAAVIDSMGWLQYRLGNYAEAERFLRRALETFHDSEIAAHLGEVLLALGKREEARQLLEDALSKDPQSPLLLEVWKSLQ
jgi:tetratricopeptide (TPR) repeat protein